MHVLFPENPYAEHTRLKVELSQETHHTRNRWTVLKVSVRVRWGRRRRKEFMRTATNYCVCKIYWYKWSPRWLHVGCRLKTLNKSLKTINKICHTTNHTIRTTIALLSFLTTPRKSEILFYIGSAELPKGITIRRPLLAGDKASGTHCKLCMTLLDFANSKSSSGVPPTVAA